MINSNSNWCNSIFANKCCIAGYTGHYVCKQNIENGTNSKRPQNTPGHISFWIFSFLCSSTYGIKSYISKEYNCCCPDDTAKSKLAKGSIIIGYVRIVVIIVNIF